MLPSVRPAQARDLPRIVELLAQLSLDEPREQLGTPLTAVYEQALGQILADPRQHLLVAEAETGVCGTACVVIVPNLSHRGRPYAIVENVVVDGARRGTGIGALLMRHAVALAKEAGCYKVSLTSNHRRIDSHRFYERLGFRPSHVGFRLDL